MNTNSTNVQDYSRVEGGLWGKDRGAPGSSLSTYTVGNHISNSNVLRRGTWSEWKGQYGFFAMMMLVLLV